MRSPISVCRLLAAAFAFSIASTSFAIPVIDTTGSWNGSDSIGGFGEPPNSATYGQTFTVTGPETVLDSFTFYVDDQFNSVFTDFVDFEVFVYAWDGGKATGPALFSSSPMSTTNNGGADGWEAITTNTGGIDLVSGSQYVAFFSGSNLFDGEPAISVWGGLNGADVYAGGQFAYSNNADNFGELFTNDWSLGFQGEGSDLAFSMRFSEQAPIPEPATVTLLGLGLAGLVARNRRVRGV